jgi:hypothetical protein
MTEEQAKSIAAVLHGDYDKIGDVWGVMVSRTDGGFVFITSDSVMEYPDLQALSARESSRRISLSPTRWDQAVGFAFEWAEVEYLRRKGMGNSIPSPSSTWRYLKRLRISPRLSTPRDLR